MCLTYPALTISAMAPTVSSIGTFGSSRGRAIDVDIVGPQPAQAIGQKILHGSRARVIMPKTAGGIAKRTKLDADLHAFARTTA